MGTTTEWATIGGRLKWVRRQCLGIRSATEAHRWLESLPADAQPESTSTQSVLRYEDGRRSPPVDYVRTFAREAGVSLLWLTTGEGRPDEPDRSDAQIRLDLVKRVIADDQRPERLQAMLDAGEAVQVAEERRPDAAGSEEG